MSNTSNPEPEPGGNPDSLIAILRHALCSSLTRRALFVVACLATLLGLFYAVENWRGKRAWEKCRRELEAQGVVLDWNAWIPAPLPDDQNIYNAPRMTEWFVRKTWTEALGSSPTGSATNPQPFSLAAHQPQKGSSVPVASVDVITADAPLPLGKADAVLKFEAPAARQEAARILQETVGPCIEGPTAYLITARPLDQIHPVRLVVQADTTPASKELAEFLYPGINYLQLAPQGSNRFGVSLQPRVYAAAEYLALSQAAVPDLDLLREALKRPGARMDSDYQRPFERPIPHFVRLRTVAQMAAQRAQCYLLLGQSEAAWHELALVRDVCRMLEAKPGSNCPTLVETMIDVAICGLYTEVVKSGLRLQAWREPELAAIQKQLADINLPPFLLTSLNVERAGTSRMFETCSAAELRKLLSFGSQTDHWWDKLKSPLYLLVTFAPRGWIYQNMCSGARLEQPLLEAFDIPNNQLLSGKLANFKQTAEALSHRPYSFLAATAQPNFVKATQTMARNQTLASEAYLACGLERYRLAHGQYPDTLEVLVPQFAARLPHDIIGGQPLKYHRTASDHFALYSVGWNEKDEGGVAGKTAAEGDWLWQ